MNLETLLSYFETAPSIEPAEIIARAVLLFVLAKLVSYLYIVTGNSLSNRSRLAGIFPMMALTTMLIIMVVKSSLALSLGLVGALSIVRFRAAIKDPEELAFIFLSISLGLGFGADQILLSVVFFGIIAAALVLRFVFKILLKGKFSDSDSLHLEITFSKFQELAKVSKLLEKHSSELKLVRFDGDLASNNSMRFIFKPKTLASLDSLSKDLKNLDSRVIITALQYQGLV